LIAYRGKADLAKYNYCFVGKFVAFFLKVQAFLLLIQFLPFFSFSALKSKTITNRKERDFYSPADYPAKFLEAAAKSRALYLEKCA